MSAACLPCLPLRGAVRIRSPLTFRLSSSLSLSWKGPGVWEGPKLQLTLRAFLRPAPIRPDSPPAAWGRRWHRTSWQRTTLCRSTSCDTILRPPPHWIRRPRPLQPQSFASLLRAARAPPPLRRRVVVLLVQGAMHRDATEAADAPGEGHRAACFARTARRRCAQGRREDELDPGSRGAAPGGGGRDGVPMW